MGVKVEELEYVGYISDGVIDFRHCPAARYDEDSCDENNWKERAAVTGECPGLELEGIGRENEQVV